MEGKTTGATIMNKGLFDFILLFAVLILLIGQPLTIILMEVL